MGKRSRGVQLMINFKSIFVLNTFGCSKEETDVKKGDDQRTCAHLN